MVEKKPYYIFIVKYANGEIRRIPVYTRFIGYALWIYNDVTFPMPRMVNTRTRIGVKWVHIPPAVTVIYIFKITYR